MSSYSIGGSPTVNEVKSALGETSTSLRTLFTSSKINKWSLWKPIKSIVESNITIEDINAAKAGLILQEITYNGSTLTGNIASSGNFNINVPLVTKEALYDKPGSANIARLGDFRWYSHDTPPTDNGYQDFYQCVKPAYNVNVGESSETSGSQKYDREKLEGSNTYDWYPNSPSFIAACSNGLLQCFNFKFSTGTGYNIGTVDELSIPLSMFNPLGNVSTSSRLRPGILFKLNTRWELCVSAKTLKENAGRTGSDMIPTLGTNTYLAEQLKGYDGTIIAIPCLAENATLTYQSIAGTNGKGFYSRVSNWTKLYSMPSGKGEMRLTCLKPDTEPVPDTQTIYGKITLYKASDKTPVEFWSTMTLKTYKDSHSGIVTSGWVMFLVDNPNIPALDGNYAYKLLIIAFVTKSSDWNTSKKLSLTTAPTSSQTTQISGTLSYKYVSGVDSTHTPTWVNDSYSGGTFTNTTYGNVPNYGLFVYQTGSTSDRIYGTIITNRPGISIVNNGLKAS